MDGHIKDLTGAVARFRESARPLWNTTLREGADWDTRDDFDQMCSVLFRAVVLRPSGVATVSLPPSSDRDPSSMSALRVVPAIEQGTPMKSPSGLAELERYRVDGKPICVEPRASALWPFSDVD
jgi:hypothetical protein